MSKKILAIIVAAIGIALWFQPLRSFGPLHQTGQQLDHLALGLIAFPALFALFTWINQKIISLVFAALYVLLAGYYVFEFGFNNLGYGLMGIVACALASLYVGSMKK